VEVSKIEYRDGALIIFTPSIAEAKRYAYMLKPGDYEIVKVKKKRSLDANSYAWVLINKIALAVRTSPEDIYRETIKDVPQICTQVCCQQRAVESLTNTWTKDHIGRRAEILPSKLNGCVNVNLYFGSSDFTQEQMSIYIDNLVQDCKTLGIETRPDYEIESLLKEWI